MREIRDAQSITTGEKIYFKGHAGATYMSDGSTVEDSIKSLSNKIGGSVNSIDTNSKLFLIGAKTQDENVETYSHDTVYVDANGDLNSTNKVKTGRVDFSNWVITDPSTESNLFKAAIEPTSTTNLCTSRIFRFGLDGQGTIDYSNCKINRQYAATNMWVAGDTYGYISTPYLDSDKANVYIGGGNRAGNSWSAKLLHSDNLNSHLTTELNSLLPKLGYTDIKYNTNSIQPIDAGWYRIGCFSNSSTTDTSSTYGSYLVSITGAWNYSNATTATFIVNKSNSSVSITQLGKGQVGATITKLRLVQDATKGNTIYLDAYKNNTTREELHYRITPLSFRFNQYGLDATTDDYGCQILTGNVAPEDGTVKQEITIFKDYDIELANKANNATTADTATKFANLTSKTINKTDNTGYPSIFLISEYTNVAGGTTNIGTYGFFGQFVSTRKYGYSQEHNGFISARLAHSDNNTGFNDFYTTNDTYLPVAVKYNNKYYIGIVVRGMGRSIELIGNFYNCLSTFTELLYQNTNTLPNGVQILRSGTFKNGFTAEKAEKVSNALTITSGSTTITYDGSAAKSITVSGGSVSGDYLPLSGGTLTGDITAPYYKFTSAAIDAPGNESNFWKAIFGSSSPTSMQAIKTFRFNDSSNNTRSYHSDKIKLFGNYASSLIWTAADTFGYINIPYASGTSNPIYIGGGNAAGTNGWSAKLLHDTMSLIPSATNTYDLGSSSLKWKTVYATTFNGSFTGNVTGTATNATTATNANNIYINTSTSSSYYPMTFVTTASAGNTKLYIGGSTGTTSTGDGIRYNPSTKTCYCSGGFYEASDERLKNFGDDIEVDLDKLSKLSKKYFTWKNDEFNAQHIGVSAQEVQNIYPELVEVIDEDGHLSVSYDKLSVIALKGIDVLNDKVKSLEERLERLEKLLNV